MSKRTKESESKSGESEDDSKQSEEEAISSEESSEDEEENEKLTASKKIAAAEAKKKKKAAAPAKPRSKKRKADDNGPPKKPTTGYAFYLKDKRPEFQAKYADLKFGDLSKKIAIAWRALNDTDKKPYADKSAEDKKRYLAQLEIYNKNKKPSTESEESSEDSSPKKRKKKKKKVVKKKIEGAPKQATNAYMYFQSAQREQIKKDNPTLKTLPQMAKKMGEIWKGMNEEEKKPYQELAGKDKIRYENEKKVFTEKLEREKKEKEAKEAKEAKEKEEEDDDDDDDSGEES
jgi:hypothetical protein